MDYRRASGEAAASGEAEASGTEARIQESINAAVQEAINASVKPLQTQIALLLQRLEAATTPAPAPMGAPTRTFPEGSDEPIARTNRKPLPTPPQFSGKRSEYAAWAQQMRDKIAIDRALYENDAALWYLINSCLDTTPRQVVATFYAAGGPEGRRDPNAFMLYLDRTYKDRNLEAKATAKLRTLHQSEEQSFAAFLPRFERVLSEAGGAEWADRVKITFLEGALNNTLKDRLITVTLPDNYFLWVERVQEVAWRVENETSRRNRTERRTNTMTNPRGRDADGDTPMTGINRAGRAAMRVRDEGVLTSEDGKLKETRKCYNCGKTGHLARNCQTGGTKPKQASVAKTRAKPSEAEAGSDSDAKVMRTHCESSEDENTEDSGKD